MNDTIAAIATARGRAAIGIVRVSGPAVPDIARGLLGEVPPARRAHHCRFKAKDGSSLDSGLALYSPAPATYTGEDTLELQGHGGGIVLDAVLERTLELGARAARPGEFTERAYLNGKIDLAQAEAVAAVIDSTSRAAAQAALRTLDGELSRLVDGLAAALLALRVEIEAHLDFTDEDAVVDLDRDSFAERLQQLRQQLAATLAAAQPGVRLREGVRVALAGPPNSGKSTLMNRLAGREVAITSAQPGTTRDSLSETVEIGGVAVELHDLAGLRDGSEDPIEREGMKRARELLRRVDRILWLTEQEGGMPPPLQTEAAIDVIVNKIDLSGAEASLQPLRGQGGGKGRERRGEDPAVGPDRPRRRRVAQPSAPAFRRGRGGRRGFHGPPPPPRGPQGGPAGARRSLERACRPAAARVGGRASAPRSRGLGKHHGHSAPR